jgi:hypothetical protein
MTLNPRPGAVVAVRLSVLAAECADPDRFGRGRRYFKEGAVGDLEIEHGVVSGSVQGSEASPYSVALRWRPQHLPGPVPIREELAVSCSCMDSAPVCKHAVALLLRFSDEVGRDPGALEQWRGSDEDWAHLPARPVLSVVPSTSGPATGGQPRSLRAVRSEQNGPSEPSDAEVLAPFFGVRDTLWGAWSPDDDDPFPDLVTLAPEPRPATSDPLALAAGGLLDEALAMLASLFG